ncbi:hypothetical protein D3C78_1716550 [compost metagenome]
MFGVSRGLLKGNFIPKAVLTVLLLRCVKCGEISFSIFFECRKVVLVVYIVKYFCDAEVNWGVVGYRVEVGVVFFFV